MKRNRQIVLWFVLCAISVVCYLPILQMPLNVYDEGIILAGAERILRGDVPYRDFWSMYPPGQFCTLALLFKLFGPSVLVERIYDLVVKSLLAVCGFVLARKLGCSNKMAIIGWGMALVWTGASGFAATPIYVVLLLILMGVIGFLRYLEEGRSRWLFYCGLVMSFSATFRHDLAGMAAGVFLVSLFLKKGIDGDSSWRAVGVYLGGVMLAGVPLAISILSVAGIGPVIEQLILTPANVMPKYRWLPYPAFAVMETSHFYVFPFISGAGLLLSWLVIKNKVHPVFSYGTFVLSLTSILFMNQVRVRSDAIHLFPTALVSVVAVPGLLSFMLSRPAKAIKVAAIMFGVMLCVLVAGFAFTKLDALEELDWPAPARPTVARAGYALMDEDLADVVSFIQDNTDEDEAIYVGATNHDQFLINDVIVYFLAGRPYGTKYHELHPGVTTTSRVQQEIVQELENTPVRWIVLRDGYWYEPNETKVDAKIELLDRYILTNYQMVKRFGGYEIWFRKP
ncbi:MAG: glycosyltransferase family 39 protein [Anaerolineae bacterium]|nr:glycosyltransferase family 39 protein [Anaerolineae bacterium]